MTVSQLRNIGLSDNEARVYLAMLELGPAAAAEIAHRAGINRPTAYAQIEYLKKAGLASTQINGKKTLYVAESPEQLLGFLEKEGVKLELRKKELRSILPRLFLLFRSTERPIVRFFEGEEGVNMARKELLKCKEKVDRAITSIDTVHKSTSDASRTAFSAARARKKIFSKIIYTSSRGPLLKANDKKRFRETKYIPAKKLGITFDLTIFDDTIVVISLKSMFGVIIKQKDIANSFKGIFDFIWDRIR